ncbi:hypothetical protein BGZ65_002183, partial [Modicella reniformis]
MATAYIELAKLMKKQGYQDEAEAFSEKAEEPSSVVSDTTSLNSTVRTLPVNPSPPSPAVGLDKQCREIAVLPAHIFAEKPQLPAIDFKLPEPDERLSSTSHLNTKERLNVLVTDVIRAFRHDELNTKAVAKVLYLEPILDKDSFRDLLNGFYSGVDQSGLLDFHQLEGLARLIQDTDPGYLEADDLVNILDLFSTHLRDTHDKSQNHMYQLALIVSHVLDAMVNAK